MRIYPTLIFLLISRFCYGQESNNLTDKFNTIYRTKDSTENYYIVLEPTAKPKGLIVVLPGFNTQPTQLLLETRLPSVAREAGYVVVVPNLGVSTFYTDNVSQQRLGTLIPEVITRYHIPSDHFIIGGHSAGGNGALLYGEHAMTDTKLVKPNAVFGVDPPLDMKRLYGSFGFIIKQNFHEGAVGEAKYFQQWLRETLGGTPQEKPAAYENISSDYRDAPDGGKISLLKNLPVRLYCDPDIQWFIENRRVPYEHINASDLSACIVQLRMLGNNRAELVTSIGKGYFANGKRHPHGLSQLDPKQFVQWASQIIP